MDQVQVPLDLTIYEKKISVPWQPACSVASVVSNSLQPYGPWPARLLCPWDSPGKNTEVGYYFPSPNLTWDKPKKPTNNQQNYTNKPITISHRNWEQSTLLILHILWLFTLFPSENSMWLCMAWGVLLPWLVSLCICPVLGVRCSGYPITLEWESLLILTNKQKTMKHDCTKHSCFFLLKKRTKDENEWNNDKVIIEE